MKTSPIFIFVELPNILAQLTKDDLFMADKLNTVDREEGYQFA
jgi:hypothetical protein